MLNLRLYKLIWAPLENELSSIENIYFSPVGDLYKIGIEYLPNEDDQNMNNLYAMHRLSTTKELVTTIPGTNHNNIVLFGGIDYDATPEELAAEKQDYEQNIVDNIQTDNTFSVKELERGSGIVYLPGTKKEVNDIEGILRPKGYNAQQYDGARASEVTFKNLGGSDNNILHIATHGFYYNKRSSTKDISVEQNFRDVNLHFVSDDVNLPNEDKMLTHSGLILAGANNKIKGTLTSNTGAEDGILYANETRTVNLSQVSLLVLSACQSGLGDISESEGVFGLQRGFKLAGVKSILMSLWKVNDEATCVLMTEFYKNIAEGKSYSEALSEAQTALRLAENGKYDKPEYWAAFILLDSLS